MIVKFTAEMVADTVEALKGCTGCDVQEKAGCYGPSVEAKDADGVGIFYAAFRPETGWRGVRRDSARVCWLNRAA